MKFTCSGSAGSTIGGLNYPPVCPAGSLLKIVIFTPNCLAHSLVVNGADGLDDTSQATYAVYGCVPDRVRSDCAGTPRGQVPGRS